MARVRLKGVNRVRHRLADGTEVIYWYAFKGGPRLRGEPGSPEFLASYQEAVSTRKAAPPGTIFALLAAYQASTDFRDLAARTRSDYVKHITEIERRFGSLPVAALASKGARAVFMAWRDELATRSRRQADYAWSVLARVLSWSLDRGLIDKNPCERGGRLYRGSRAEHVWADADEQAFLDRAPAHLRLPLILALWTGQRQGDLLRLTWAAFDGRTIRLRQSKTGARVVIPVGAPLKAALDATPRRSTHILTTAEGRPWTADGFRSSWRKACLAAGVTDLTFHDLRGTAVTRLALAGCTEAEIATITGHSLGDVRSILDSHYLARDPALAQSAIDKLEMRTHLSKSAPKTSGAS